jgi:hypothetical protein
VTRPNFDPLSGYLAAVRLERNARPIPLTATKIAVGIIGGLATVTTERRFRNNEPLPIKAVITFPVPVDEVLVGVAARIGDRAVRSRAQRRELARETYEDALDRGKAAVLHEEVLRGVHMLSVAQLAPGTELMVTSTWATLLANHAKGAQLRIPTTVGDIYGASPLADSDDLMHADVIRDAELELTCDQGQVYLGDTVLAGGPAQVPLDRQIELTVSGWQPRVLFGVAADGRSVRLDVRPAENDIAPIDAELVVDRSGSMGERCADAVSATKHSVVCEGLRGVARSLLPADRVRLWEFAEAPMFLGAAQGGDLEGLVERLRPPNGGTEIGKALAAAATRSESNDILLITDGKSHALDVHALGRTGKRFTVVLVGEDSLEANVGHLAGLSGGQLFIVAGSDAAEAVMAAFRSIRSSHVPSAPVEGPPTKIALRRRGMAVEAEWSDAPAPDSDVTAHVGAVAAALALPLLPEDAAAVLAEAHALGCHLTSLVLVDEEGEAQAGLPAMRRVPLPTPRTVMHRERRAAGLAGREGMELSVDFAEAERVAALKLSDDAMGGFANLSISEARYRPLPPAAADLEWLLKAFEDLAREAHERLAELKSLAGQIDDLARQVHEQAARASAEFEASVQQILEALVHRIHDVAALAHEQIARSRVNLSRLVGRIDWTREPDRLRRGDLSGLGPDIAEAIRRAAQQAAVMALADHVQLPPVCVVVALLAHAEQHRNRNARRLFRAVLGRAAAPALAAAAAALGLG